MCLPQFGLATGVVVAPDVKFVEILVHSFFLILRGIDSLANRGFVGDVGPSGDH